MKKSFLLSLVVLLFAFGCSQTPEISQVVFNPEQPTVNDGVKVIFVPGKQSPLLEAESVLLMAQYYPTESGDIYLNELQMKKNGNKWVAEITMNDSTGAILFNFSEGEKIDSQDKIAWDLMVYNETDQPVKGGYGALAKTYLSAIYMERERDIDKAIEYLQKERELYPDNWRALTDGWYYRARNAKDDEAELAKIDAEVDSLAKAHPGNKDILTQAYHHFSRKKKTEKADELLEQIKKVDPETIIPVSNEWTEIRRIKDSKKRIQVGRKLLSRIKSGTLRTSLEGGLASSLIKAKDWKNAVEFVDKMEKPDPNNLNRIAFALAEENIMLLHAEQFAKKAVDLNREGENNEKPSYMPTNKWVERQKYTLGNSLDTYGYTQHKLGKLEEAEKTLAEAYEQTDGENADITEHYLQCLVDNKKSEKAATVAQKAIENNFSNDKIVELFRTAFAETGDAAAADSIINTAKNKASENKKEEIAGNFIQDAQPAPTFTLANLDGKDISLESLKGKTVIVDFWATWCGPCVSSFPFLQKFWEQHQNDPDVMVVAVNCWERTKGDERLKAVKEFMDDKGYTFPVLIDKNDKVVSAYKVEGIPTKFFVGPDGKIYFKDVGFHGPSMVDDMNIELEMIREKVQSAQ